MNERLIRLLRHGETVAGSGFFGASDVPLSEAGRTRMWDAAASVEAPDVVITSPLSRCRTFAVDYAGRHGIAVETEPRLREMHFGYWEGRAVASVFQEDAGALEAFWTDPRANPPPGGERLEDFEARVESAWRAIRMRDERSILVVTHGGPIRLVTLWRDNLTMAALLAIPVPHGSLHEFRVTPSDAHRCMLSPTGAPGRGL